MNDFRASGKKIIAWSPSYEQSTYYAAAQADEVVMDPMGSVSLEGFSAYNNYFKDGLDKLGVDVHVFRVGEYKSAVEPFTRNDMRSEEHTSELQSLMRISYAVFCLKKKNSMQTPAYHSTHSHENSRDHTH